MIARPKSHVLCLRIPHSIFETVKEVSITDGLGYAEVIRDALVRDFTQRGFWPPSRQVGKE